MDCREGLERKIVELGKKVSEVEELYDIIGGKGDEPEFYERADIEYIFSNYFIALELLTLTKTYKEFFGKYPDFIDSETLSRIEERAMNKRFQIIDIVSEYYELKKRLRSEGKE